MTLLAACIWLLYQWFVPTPPRPFALGDLALPIIAVLVALVLLAFLILAAIKAYQGQYYKLPIVGNIAWNIVNK